MKGFTMQPRIFIIDDDKELCEEITEILSGEGYSVNAAYDGLKGKKIIENGNYDLLILDIKLPGLNGFEVLKSIRGKNIKIKIIIISGRPKNTSLMDENKIQKKIYIDEETTLKLADAVISKPFDIKIMLEKVRELLKL
ncbi:MAG: response regulator [bacterium]